MKMRRSEKAAVIISAAAVLAAAASVAFTDIGKIGVAVTVGTSQYATAQNEGAISSELININTATALELCSLPGIGEGLAAKIIEYREKNGAFRDISDIIDVSGIGIATFEEIKDKITV